MKHSFYILIFLVVCDLVSTDGVAQVATKTLTQNESSYVTWVNQYPRIDAEKVKHPLFNKVVEFFIGKKQSRKLLKPISIFALNPNEITVLDQGNQTLFDISGNEYDIPNCIRKKENYFTSLVGMCSLPGGELLFTDSRLNQIFVISADKKHLRLLNDTLKLQQPTGIAYSPVSKQIWVIETSEHRIAVLNTKGERIKTIGERGEENGKFNFPTSLCIDKNGEAYVVDAMNFRIQIFNDSGAFVSTFGSVGDVSGTFARPKGIAIDSYGDIYVVDALFHAVQIFDKAGNFLYQFGKQGKGKEEFWMPNGIYIDSKNYIYVADTYNSRIQIFHLING
ncbi:MAG: 6-bladed beta-propeller [Bacteroidota bacterium]